MKQVAIRTCFLGLSAPTFGQIPEASTGKWVPTWIAMPQEVEWWNLPAAPYIALFTLFADSTIRQTALLRTSASRFQTFSDRQIFAGSVHQVTFSESKSYTIPSGVQIVSDPILLAKIEHWYFLSAVEAWVPSDSQTVWEALQIKTRAGQNLVLSHMQNSSNPTLQSVAVINQAAVGNRVLADIQGPSALSRIERDVLSYPSVRYVIVFEGTNDIGVAGTDPESQSSLYE
ncbi:extracellular gdsl-like lipase [Moniliophthora roreri]|nr:extracellular gdsl-like lipase [Moniliophthora roreri]